MTAKPTAKKIVHGLICIFLPLYAYDQTNSATMVAASILGRNDTPPKRGIARLCTFRESGISYKFLFLQKFRMRGMKIKPHVMLKQKAIRLTTMYIFMFVSKFLNKFNYITRFLCFYCV